jgi:UDP-2-acetamido-2,6-beta-L-arabino-hexul-4-ose reductase
MKILVTGAKGFIGKNLITELRNQKYEDIFEYDLDSNEEELDGYCKESDYIFHLAGVNRPKNKKDFMKGNFGFTSVLIEKLKKHNNNCTIMISSSVQAELNNPYGLSKKAGEDLMFSYEKETKTKVLVYRFPNVFGKWCKPNYNSAVATFSYNIANDLPINVNNPDVDMKLIYIDDLVKELINALMNNENKKDNFCYVEPVYQIKLGKIVDLLYSFKESRNNLYINDMNDDFTKKLHSNYLSYLPEDKFSYDLKMNIDNRGSFTEFLKTIDRGQVSVNVSKPGITKGNHWHHTKTEKFLVVSGKGVIRFRKIDETKVLEYHVSGDKLQVVDIPPGYTHNIENLGKQDMVTIMWANETFDPNNPDTYYLEV